ncbi:MAG TPA: adventurous gliding motility TPR repeat lipoprotein GltE, partial [Anaeromyxobacter sp.]|nr:adventurous gliding motility TPR repeat lipoprotein GltE [Anaeromyxobacter sp.]
MSPRTTLRAGPLGALAAALALCACATSGTSSSPKQAQAARPGAATPASTAPSRPVAKAGADASSADAAESLSPRAQRLFDEAVQADAEQKKLKVPTDWPYLERKWRAVLDEADVAEARFNLGVALEAQGKLEDARAEYERARSLKPGLRQAVVNLGVLLERQGDLRGAAAAYQDAMRDFPDDAVSRERLAVLYRQAGQLDEAWRLAREALVREPRSIAAQKVLVHVALARNDLDLAKLVAMRAQKLDAADPELPFLAGQVLAKQGDDAAAAAQFKKALAIRGDYLAARYALLQAALKKQTWGAVAEQAAAIVKVDPGNAALHLVHGIALKHLGKADDALAAYQRAEKAGGEKLPE